RNILKTCSSCFLGVDRNCFHLLSPFSIASYNIGSFLAEDETVRIGKDSTQNSRVKFKTVCSVWSEITERYLIMSAVPQPPRTYNQNHTLRKYIPGKRRVSIYWTWSYPWESNRKRLNISLVSPA